MVNWSGGTARARQGPKALRHHQVRLVLKAGYQRQAQIEGGKSPCLYRAAPTLAPALSRELPKAEGAAPQPSRDFDPLHNTGA